MSDRGGLKLVHILLLLGAFFLLWAPSGLMHGVLSPFLGPEYQRALEMKNLAQSLGDQCVHKAQCGDVAMIDCGAAVDGALYYFNSTTKEKISSCGGSCDRAGGCSEGTCPPKEWTCDANGKEQGAAPVVSEEPAAESAEPAATDVAPATAEPAAPAEGQ